MTLPCTPEVRIRLGTGPNFGAPFVLGSSVDGVLGTDQLASSAIVVVDVSNQVQQIAIRHGRDRNFEQYLPGDAVVRFLDFNGDWNPANTSSPYYGEIKPMRQLQIVTQYQGTEYFLFSGYITSWDYEWADPSVDYAIVTVDAVDAMRNFRLAQITTITGAAANDLPGQRINQILDEVDWPPSLRNIDPGDTELENDHGETRSVLRAIQEVEESDLGAFFIDHQGKPTYYGRTTLSQKAAGTAYEFDDQGTNIQYQAIDISYDETELYNQVNFGRRGHSVQTAEDTASIDEYFLRSLTRENLIMKNNTIALQQANRVLNYRKQVRIRVDSITLDLSSDSNRVEPALTLELGDPVIVNKQIAGGTDITLRLTIQGHNHDITPDRWITTLSTAYPLSAAFVLGSAELGILGTSTL